MNKKALTLMNNNELAAALKTLSLEELKQEAATIAAHQVATVVRQLKPGTIDNWQPKLQMVISSFPHHHLLEAAGRALSAEQLHALLQSNDLGITKGLPALFVGVDPDCFSELLLLIKEPELKLLKQESCTEPLQHQLTLFTHQMELELENFVGYLRNLEDEIERVNPKTMNFQLLEALFALINTASSQAMENLHRLDNALAIAWNCSREDLIAALSFQKECWQKYLALAIGEPAQAELAPTGLYAHLEAHLNRIFSSPRSAEEIETLHDEEPAVEALAKLSIWYLHDYWEIGLIPSVSDPNKLDLETENHTMSERSNYRAGLFLEAQQELQRLGLKNVRDLKRAHIYSKKMLIEYIARKRKGPVS